MFFSAYTFRLFCCFNKGRSSDECSGPEDEVLTWSTVSFDTSELKEFENPKRRPRRKKKTSEVNKLRKKEENVQLSEFTRKHFLKALLSSADRSTATKIYLLWSPFSRMIIIIFKIIDNRIWNWAEHLIVISVYLKDNYLPL